MHTMGGYGSSLIIHVHTSVCVCHWLRESAIVRSVALSWAAMISIELWRARIGSFHCRWSCHNGSSFSSSFRPSSKRASKSSSPRHHSVRILGETLLVLTSITVVAVLLLASGDVEMNPGPRIAGKAIYKISTNISRIFVGRHFLCLLNKPS